MAVFTLAPLDIPMYLDDVDAEPEPRTKPAAAEQERVVVQPRVGADPATVFFAERNAASALDLIDQLATEGGLKIEWTAEAKKALLHRSLQLHLHDWELRDVLDHTCDFLDLVCELDVDCVRISMAAKADPKLLSAFRRGIAQRALFAALRVDPEHSHAAASLLELGNVEAAQNRWNEAVFWYNRVALDHGLSPHAVAAHFNTGQAHLNRRDPARARKALFRVVDQSPGHELALLAGIQIGQLCLQENDALQAIVHLRRAQQYAISSPHQPTATLMLAAAQLHAED
jgi:tetratricopeptide (TPR) repeat protein